MRILITGATGYVGGRLVPHLLTDGHDVVCLVRPQSSLDRPFSADVEIRAGSVENVDQVAAAATGCDVAFYLVHSLNAKDFEEQDRLLAEGFRAGCEKAGVGRIVYLGGLGREDTELSPHLRSRQEVGRVLADGNVAVTELRAAVLIGSGSASFEMLRSLSDVLPVTVVPSWVHRTRCQPTAISDALSALRRCVSRTAPGHEVLELGGPDVLTYYEMMQQYAECAQLPRRRMLSLPVLTPRLSSLWVSLVTPLPHTLSSQLVESLINDVVVTQRSATEELGIDPIRFADAVALALTMIEDLVIPTSWSGSAAGLDATPDADDPSWAGGLVLEDLRTVQTTASASDVYAVITRIGGDEGWPWGGWLWAIRGAMDKVSGGVGMRRGRRHPQDLAVGDALDFWRVVRIEENCAISLRAEMRLPGYAWLEWQIEEIGPSETRLTQRARYVPRGLLGRLYWYALVPFHVVLFPRMARRIVEAAEKRAAGSAGKAPLLHSLESTAPRSS